MVKKTVNKKQGRCFDVKYLPLLFVLFLESFADYLKSLDEEVNN